MAVNIYNYIREQIKNYRHLNHLTQQQLADRANITKQSISRIERGKLSPSLDTLYDLSDALNCSIYDLLPRNNVSYRNMYGNLLVGGVNGIQHYKDTNTITTDYSLNVVNSRSVAILHSLGVDTVTLSYEVSKNNIQEIVNNYLNNYQTYPQLELIAYGRLNLMVTKYCPLRKLNMCGNCKKNQYVLNDDIASFPLKFNDDCTITILNSKTLNLIDDLAELKGIASLRLVFTTESVDEVRRVIRMYQDKLNNLNSNTRYFNSNTDTRGHFNREIQ
mgnify:CR=1 FL=1